MTTRRAGTSAIIAHGGDSLLHLRFCILHLSIHFNIVENALKFTPIDGRVELIARSEGRAGVSIMVRDSGRGIPAEALPHIFDRFYRADPARSRQLQRVDGSGLGLAIARELIEAQGGKIMIESTPGVGTTVTLRFMAAAPQPTAFLARGKR